MSKENGYKNECGSCKWLDTEHKSKYGYACSHPARSVGNYIERRHMFNKAPKKCYEGKDGQAYDESYKLYFSDKTLKEHDAQVASVAIKNFINACAGCKEKFAKTNNIIDIFYEVAEGME